MSTVRRAAQRRAALSECVGCGGPALPGCALCDGDKVARMHFKNGRTATKCYDPKCKRVTYCPYCDGDLDPDDHEEDGVAFTT